MMYNVITTLVVVGLVAAVVAALIHWQVRNADQEDDHE